MQLIYCTRCERDAPLTSFAERFSWAGPVRKRREQSVAALLVVRTAKMFALRQNCEESVRQRCWSDWARSRERTGADGEAGVPLVGSAGGDSRARSGFVTYGSRVLSQTSCEEAMGR